jgi:hypothetical protein
MALFPTQYKTWQSYQELGRKELCGRPGVNGGYMEDKESQFGINCYGKKPYADENDKKYMKKHSYSTAYADEDLKEQQRKNDKKKKLLIAPFNKEKWNEN